MMLVKAPITNNNVVMKKKEMWSLLAKLPEAWLKVSLSLFSWMLIEKGPRPSTVISANSTNKTTNIALKVVDTLSINSAIFIITKPVNKVAAKKVT